MLLVNPTLSIQLMNNKVNRHFSQELTKIRQARDPSYTHPDDHQPITVEALRGLPFQASAKELYVQLYNDLLKQALEIEQDELKM